MAALVRLLQQRPLIGPVHQQLGVSHSVRARASKSRFSSPPWPCSDRSKYAYFCRGARSFQLPLRKTLSFEESSSSSLGIFASTDGAESVEKRARTGGEGRQGRKESPKGARGGADVAGPSSAVEGVVVAAAAATTAKPPEKIGPWLIVGLGNPGSKYVGTRHNVGFDLIDRVAESEGISLGTVQCKALVGKGRIGNVAVLLAKPQTFMNVSGQAVGPLAKYYKIPLQRILVVCDDLDLALSTLRLRPKGGHAGHNGMKSIIDSLQGSRDFARLRIGIGRPSGGIPVETYVLQKFSKTEKEEIDFTLHQAKKAVKTVVSEGMDKAMNVWNVARSLRISD